MKSFRGYFFILGATLFWGLAATIAKFLFSRHMDPLILVQMRMTFSFLILAMFFGIFRRDILRVRAKDIPLLALLGIIGGAGSNFTYYFTIEQTNVATAILLQYIAPLMVLLYAVVSRNETVTSTKIVAGVVSLGGCYLAIAGKDFSILHLNSLGLVSGLASAFCWAFANVVMKRLVQRYRVWTCIVYMFLFASAFWIVVNPPWKIFSAGYPLSDWEILFFFAIISVLIPHSLYFGGVRYLAPTQAIISATTEPIFAIAFAYILLGEGLSPVQLLGAALVIGAILMLQLPQSSSENVAVLEPPAAPTP